MAEGTPAAAPETPANPGGVASAQESPNTASEPPASTPIKDVPAAEENLPLREDFIQNAVKFLSHPKVQGSPVQYRRSFLEKKGLNGAEITEAFKRVPDTATAPSASVPATTTVTTTTTTPAPAGTPVTAAPVATAIPRKPWEQSFQPTAAYAPAVQQITAAQPQQMQPQPRQGMRWTQMVLALGLLSAAGAGTVVATKAYVVPRLKTWLRRWLLDISEEQGGVRKLTPAEEAANAASAAASAAAEATALMKEAREDIKGASTEGDRKLETILAAFQSQTKELTSTLDSLKDALEGMEASRKEAVILGTAGHPEGAPPVSLADLRKELFKFTSVVTGFSGTSLTGEASSTQGLSGADVSELKALVQERRASSQSGRGPAVDQEYVESEDGLNWLQSSQTGFQTSDPNLPQYDSPSRGPVNVPVDRRALGTTAAGRAGLADQGLAMRLASAAMEPRLQEVNGSRESAARPASAGPLTTYAGQELPNRPVTSPPQAPDQAPHSKSYMEVLQMLKDGKPIPGIRDIDDKPPNPNQAPTDPKLKPRAKPWEKGFQQVAEKPANGLAAPPAFNVTNSRNGTSSNPSGSTSVYSPEGQAPWWRRAQAPSEPGVRISQPGQDGYLPETEDFVHPALAGDIEPPGQETARAEPASGNTVGESSLARSSPGLQSSEVQAGQPPQPGPSGSMVGAGSSQAGFSGASSAPAASGAPAVAPKPAWRPPAVPTFAMPSAADAIKGKGKLVPVTPMASSAHREERVAMNGSNTSEQSQGGGSSQSANGEVQGADKGEKSFAEVVEVGASSQENVEVQ